MAISSPGYRIGFLPVTAAYLQHLSDISQGNVPLVPPKAIPNLEGGEHADRDWSQLLLRSVRWVLNED